MTMNPADAPLARQKLVKVIGDSVVLAETLIETLGNERGALEAQDMDALQDVLARKTQCVESLRQLDQRRSAICTGAGFADGDDQMDHIIEWCDENHAVADGWRHLVNLAVECNRRNMTNGAIIRARKQQIESAMAIVRGGSANSDTYSRQGVEPGVNNLRSIVEA